MDWVVFAATAYPLWTMKMDFTKTALVRLDKHRLTSTKLNIPMVASLSLMPVMTIRLTNNTTDSQRYVSNNHNTSWHL